MKGLTIKVLLAACAASVAAAPAAAIPGGSAEKVKIATTPSGALATAENGNSCRTPCSLRLPLKTGGKIDIELEGYEPQTVTVGSHVDARIVARDTVSSATDPFAAAVNAFALAVWGSASYKSLDARKIDIALVPLGAVPEEEADAVPAAAATDAAAAARKPVYGPTLPPGSRPLTRK